MILRSVSGGTFAALLSLAAATAGDCGPAGERVLFGACPGEYAAELILMPEGVDALAAPPPGSLTVTGGYTATDTRGEGLPKPVGLYIHRGRAVSLELGRMDGLLIVELDGAARIALVSDLTLDGKRHDLGSIEGRRAFAAAMEARSALQSHLLIRDGEVDARPMENAPLFRRRILFQQTDGSIGVWDSGARPMTLHDAAVEVRGRHAPEMALNLDMGSYNFCEIVDGEGRSSNCGGLTLADTGKLSNLIRIVRHSSD